MKKRRIVQTILSPVLKKRQIFCEGVRLKQGIEVRLSIDEEENVTEGFYRPAITLLPDNDYGIKAAIRDGIHRHAPAHAPNVLVMPLKSILRERDHPNIHTHIFHNSNRV